MQAELVAHAERWGVAECVRFIPRIDDPVEILSVLDVFVMPSLNEGLGLGLMEAMSCARAVVGSNVGGIKSLIIHGKNGLLVPPQQPAALADALITLLRDPHMREQLGNRARSFIADRFTLDRMVEQTELVYAECLRKE